MGQKTRQIIPIGGGGFYRDPENLELEKYVIAQSGAPNPRVAFVPTASGEPDQYVASFYPAFLKLGCRPSVLTFFKRTPDLRTFLLNQDVIYVGGGNTKKPACRLARLGRRYNPPRGLGVRHRSHRRQRGRDLLVRGWPDRFLLRWAQAASLSRVFARKLLSAL